ncbi:MAG: hypothetical protein ACR2IV_05880 [Bryobacteraceae bacterium]
MESTYASRVFTGSREEADSSAATSAQAPTAVTFDPSTHSYSFHGRRLISVTQVIHAAGLIRSEWYTEAARQRGRAVHLAIHFDAERDLDESSVSPLIRPYLEAARNFKRDTGFVTELTEARVWAIDLSYAGTLDHLGLIGKKQRVLVDWKTGVVPEWARLQTAGYANGFPNGAGFLRYAVQLKPDGAYKITSFEPQEFRRDFTDFLACVRVAQLQEEQNV